MVEESIRYGEYMLEISQDEDPVNPREDDTLGLMACAHKRYNLGDAEEKFNSDNYDGWDAVEEMLKTDRGATAILPLYLYDHSGITMSTSSFSCRWDSGQVGFIYTNPDRVKAMGLEGKTEAELLEMLRGEVELYDKFLQGDIYGFKLLKDVVCDKCQHNMPEMVDSCWGFYGSDWRSNGMRDHLPKEFLDLADKE